MIKKYKVRFMWNAFRVYYTHQENGLEVVICSSETNKMINKQEHKKIYLHGLMDGWVKAKSTTSSPAYPTTEDKEKSWRQHADDIQGIRSER